MNSVDRMAMYLSRSMVYISVERRGVGSGGLCRANAFPPILSSGPFERADVVLLLC